MFFEISKLLHILVSPITWILLLVLGAVWFQRWLILRFFCISTAILFFFIFTCPVLQEWVCYQLSSGYRQPSWRNQHVYETAIVMGGFGKMNAHTGSLVSTGKTSDRLWEAVRLYRLGKVKKILITGDSSIDEKVTPHARELFLTYMAQQGVSPIDFILENQARNSYENAVYSIQLLKERGQTDRDCLLITSSSHIKRSLECFASQGWHPDWFPAGVPDAPSNITHRSFYPQWETAIEWQSLFHEWLGNMVYRWKGYSTPNQNSDNF